MNKFFYALVCLIGLIFSPLVIAVIAAYHVRDEIPGFYKHLFDGILMRDEK